ncbi:MAG: branched-chain-amino-acid transaminase [Omnitrophica WOR_2 bacterium RIFCSPHIGHO2_01_FULL_48_9]|nr:MAG: branched-chain-amino-acid transaminase [Omnitrophica WOR_2 bacterium RIFCSPHIGHO2_02_FULL_48_11]OGX33782.1 MAG: branched-chain-amino-acid transaminase [Omnitrophica WOR_2 bacterium RIFCSPHIGHO2_01_FULL_48_9]
MKIFINGQFFEKKDAKVSVFDHGFLYGDGAFEGIRSYNGLVFKLNEHIGRLFETAHTMMIHIPVTKQQLAKHVVETLKKNNLRDAYIRLIVTRGEGDLGLDPRKCYGKPNIIIITDKIVLYPAELYQKGLEIITVPTMRNHNEALNPQLKSLNYLNNILAKIEANNSGFSEAIMLDGQGYVAECTGDNIFILKDGVLATPYNGRLRGITRDAVLALAAKNKIQTLERLMTRHEIFNADECFLTGTAAEIIPVVRVDGRLIADGKPGKVTQKMMKLFHEMTRKAGVKY